MTQRNLDSATTSSGDKYRQAFRSETQEKQQLMSKVDGNDFINELYEILNSEGSDTTLPQAVCKFVDVHAQDFVFTMAQRYKDKTVV